MHWTRPRVRSNSSLRPLRCWPAGARERSEGILTLSDRMRRPLRELEDAQVESIRANLDALGYETMHRRAVA